MGPRRNMPGLSTSLNFFKEKLILQEEEKQLKKMLEKVRDQQNRLKIEELALSSLMKMEKEQLEKGKNIHRSVTGSVTSRTISSITSEEMNNYAAIGVVDEDASVINQQSLDLSFEPFPGQGLADDEEEEEVDSEDEEKQAETHQLKSLMENL